MFISVYCYVSMIGSCTIAHMLGFVRTKDTSALPASDKKFVVFCTHNRIEYQMREEECKL